MNRSTGSSADAAIRARKVCTHAGRVKPLAMTDVHPEVHYWRCEDCGLVWAIRDCAGIESRFAPSHRQA